MGVKVLLEVELVGLMPLCVVAVGAKPVFAAGPGVATLVGCGMAAPPSSLSNGRRDHPSGIVTPEGRSALPEGIAAVFGRATCLAN